MNIKLNTTVKITELNTNNNHKVINFLYKTGIVVGTRKIKKQFIVLIIEFKDYSRIWMFTKEITSL